MNKKADIAPGFAALVIIAIVGFIIGVGYVSLFVSRLPDEAAQQVCHSSVSARAKTEVQVKVLGISKLYGTMTPVPLLCKSRDVKLSGNKEEVQKQLADLMDLCWWAFGEGKYAAAIEDRFSGDTCFPCFSVTIKDIKDGDKITANEFDNWLRSHNDTDRGESYHDYLTKHEGIPGSIGLFNDIEEKKTYYVMYSDPKYATTSAIPNGIYFVDVNTPPKTASFGIGPLAVTNTCEIITGVTGT